MSILTPTIPLELLQGGPRGISHMDYQEFGQEFTAATAAEMYSTMDACVVESINFACSDPSMQLRVMPNDANGNTLGYLKLASTVQSGALGFRVWTPTNLASPSVGIGGKTDQIQSLKYDAATNHYVLGLVRPIICPNGVTLQAVGAATGTTRVICSFSILFFA